MNVHERGRVRLQICDVVIENHRHYFYILCRKTTDSETSPYVFEKMGEKHLREEDAYREAQSYIEEHFYRVGSELILSCLHMIDELREE